MKNINTLEIKTQEKSSSTATFPFSTSDLLHNQNFLCQRYALTSGAYYRIVNYLMCRVNFTFKDKGHLKPQIALGETVGLTDEKVAEEAGCKPSTVSTFRNAVKGTLLTFERARSKSGHSRCGVWIYYFHSFVELGLERRGKPIPVKVSDNVITPRFKQVDEEEINDEINDLKARLQDDRDWNKSQQTLEVFPVNTGISEAEKEASKVDDDCVSQQKSHHRYLQSQSIYLNYSLIELESYSISDAKCQEMAEEFFETFWQPNRKRHSKKILSRKHHLKSIGHVIEHALKFQLCTVGQLYEKLSIMFDDDRNVNIVTPLGFIRAVDGQPFIETYLPHPAKMTADAEQKELIRRTRERSSGVSS